MSGVTGVIVLNCSEVGWWVCGWWKDGDCFSRLFFDRMKLKEGKKKSRGKVKRDSLLLVVCFIWDEMFSIFVGDKERSPLERQVLREAWWGRVLEERGKSRVKNTQRGWHSTVEGIFPSQTQESRWRSCLKTVTIIYLFILFFLVKGSHLLRVRK